MTFTGKVFIGTSLDGYIARPDGDIGWLTSRGEKAGHDLGYKEFMDGVGTVVLGRVTYEKVLGFGADMWPYEGKRVAVLSTTLADDDPRVTVHRSMDDLVASLEGGVYVDGGRVVQAFLRAGHIHEITVSTVPVLIGAGFPLFGELDADVPLTLQRTADMGAGIVQTTYTVDR
ncbi:dihydrofolate reductase family protein [Actinomadura macrotermitis]|uniref:Bacterial bifunctional deaminase-reductase C-terminal domain-containing protein n=1 Tax=Actinomadura macrotermitis TaxID=2585200 RepID=A0A7K0BVG0_9ACTN|nr:dihydrofolate reductase family protein [Actinomadura macrotermitis]MQY05165.1 putative protein YyaP [Actinomadura macrotermitis]